MIESSPPVGREPNRPEPSSSLTRQIALVAVVFIATIAILAGIAAVIQGSGDAGPGISGSARPTTSVGAGQSAPAVSGGPSPTPSTGVPTPDGSASSPPGSPTPSGDPVLIGAGDIADCDRDRDSETAALLAGQDGIVFTAGDNAYPSGTAAEFADCYGPTWGRELYRTRPVPGNHDHRTADLVGYLGYFGDAAAPEGTTWYSYDIGTWHVIALDATCEAAGGCGPDSAQGQWLAGDLSASDATCTLAIWHQPRFSSGEHGNDEQTAPFWDVLYAAGAEVVVNAHDHDYERFAPQDPAGRPDPERGIREFVVGTGGAALRDFGVQAANSELRVAGYDGVIRLVLHHSSYEWSFLTTAGIAIDAGNGNCH